MEKSFIIAGFGGQGVLLAGEVLASAFMSDDKNVTWYPSYGAEMRGGTVNCQVVMNDSEAVSSVNKKEVDFVIAMNDLSFEKFLPKLKKGGMMIANSSLVKEIKKRTDINYIFAPLNKLASEIGNVKTASMMSLGVLAKASELITVEKLISALDSILPEHRKKLLPINIKAIEAGFALNFALNC